MGKNKGFIQTLFLIFIFVLIVSFLELDLRGMVQSEIFKNNIAVVKNAALDIFNFLKPFFDFFWENIFKPYIFEPLKSFIEEKSSETGTSTPLSYK